MTDSAGAIRVVLVDDQLLLRQSLAALIDSHPPLTVVGQAADGLEALDVISATGPDIVLMDVRIPRLDGIEATRRICADASLASTRILVLSMFELDEYVYAALRAGASGFLLKDSHPTDLVAAIVRTHEGESLFAPSILGRLVEHFITAPRYDKTGSARPTITNLTERELEILELIGLGLPNDQIALRLRISIKTVKTHVSNLLRKLDARDRTHLVITAYDAGIVTPPKPHQP